MGRATYAATARCLNGSADTMIGGPDNSVVCPHTTAAFLGRRTGRGDLASATDMTPPTDTSYPQKLSVIVAGGGVAALETVLALGELAGERTDVTVIAPDPEFVYRPMTVREPFAYGSARRYPLAPIVADAGARLLAGELEWVDPAGQLVHTRAGEQVAYDALVLALGGKAHTRYPHALTIDDRRLDETLHGLIQDIEGGYVHSLAFVAPGRMPWQLPIYELALMTAGRAYDADIELAVTIVTPEDAPLAIFGANASSAVGELLARAHIQTITSAYAEVPGAGEVVINPGDRRLLCDRVVALPELYGPSLRGIPLANTASSAWTPTGSCSMRGRSGPPGTRSSSRSSTAGSPPSRPTPSRNRSRRSPARRSRPSRFTRSSTACCSLTALPCI